MAICKADEGFEGGSPGASETGKRSSSETGSDSSKSTGSKRLKVSGEVRQLLDGLEVSSVTRVSVWWSLGPRDKL